MVLVIVVLVFVSSRGDHNAHISGNPNEPGVAAPYSKDLPLSELKMSTADIGTGGQIYYVSGKISNTGGKTVSGATVELLFHDGIGKICQRENEQLRVVVATEPALDTTDLAHAPLHPGESREFQIPVERISAQWDGQYPSLTVVHVTTQ